MYIMEKSIFSLGHFEKQRESLWNLYYQLLLHLLYRDPLKCFVFSLTAGSKHSLNIVGEIEI